VGPFISLMQQSVTETRRSFPELIGAETHGVDGFLRRRANRREIHAQGEDVSHESNTVTAMLRCISRITVRFGSGKCVPGERGVLFVRRYSLWR